eukprot:CAMPEP_0176167318 /NCGR_PEP_ID=MMETSP0120_2-20121206/85600_1 /TAXON_ID=160619 /ORGANISM="Kryptoperidinium foliaceum, Strain CCMP 1326" /LENGTH=42 /DNA_ID= /DNA_START= /DNA_END= /DNA_ORIENTATION=
MSYVMCQVRRLGVPVCLICHHDPSELKVLTLSDARPPCPNAD